MVGKKPGRSTPDKIIIFDSTGMALQDVVVAAAVYEEAIEQNLGMEVYFGGHTQQLRKVAPSSFSESVKRKAGLHNEKHLEIIQRTSTRTERIASCQTTAVGNNRVSCYHDVCARCVFGATNRKQQFKFRLFPNGY